MALQILTRGQFGKMRNFNFVESFLAVQDNILLQPNDLVQLNNDISKTLLEITSKIDSLIKKYKDLTSQLTMTKNTSKVLQETLDTTSIKLAEL